MGTYIALCNYTDKGIANIKDSPDRAEAARKALQAMGGDMDQLYLTMGGYDLVAIVTLPSDEDAAKFMLTLGEARKHPDHNLEGVQRSGVPGDRRECFVTRRPS